MFQDLNLDRYENRLVDFNSFLFCPRRFTQGSRLPSYLALRFPNIFNSPIPWFERHQFFTLYMVVLMLHLILECFETKDFEVILLNHELSDIFNTYFCTRAELRNIVKEHLEPLEHFELDLFDPLSQCFPTYFGSRHPYLELKLSGGTPSGFIRYKYRGIEIIRGTLVGNHCLKRTIYSPPKYSSSSLDYSIYGQVP